MSCIWVDKGENQKVVIFDLGAYGLNISIIDINDHKIEIIVSNKKLGLGGMNFNQRLVNHLINIINRKKKKKYC